MSILLDRSNRVLIQGATGHMGTFFVEDARKYGTTVAAIREANALRGNAIKMKHTYRIPVKSIAKKSAEPETRQRRGTAKQAKQAKHR